MAKKQHDTPNLDQLESGPWPSFVTGIKRLAKDKDIMVDLLGHLEHSYQTRKGYWKGPWRKTPRRPSTAAGTCCSSRRPGGSDRPWRTRRPHPSSSASG